MFRNRTKLKDWFVNCCLVLSFLVTLGFIVRTPRISNWLFPLQIIELKSQLSENEMEAPDWPTTTSQAVMLITEELTDDDRSAIGNLRYRDMIQFHHGLGTYVRNRFGLWRGNTELLKSTGKDHPDDASQVILEQLYTHLANTSG